MSAEQADPLPRLRMGTRVRAKTDQTPYPVLRGHPGTIVDSMNTGSGVRYLVQFDDVAYTGAFPGGGIYVDDFNLELLPKPSVNDFRQ